jgi:hypothetical protein
VVGRAASGVFLAWLLLAPTAAAEDPLPGGRAIFAEASISPDTHFFADAVVAQVELVLDPAQLDPERVRVGMSFSPYGLLGPIQVTRRTVGELVSLRYAARLRCLHISCIAPRFRTALGEQEGGRAERYRFRFRPAEVLYKGEGGRSRLLFRRSFPAVEVVSRINTAQVEAADQPVFTRSAYTATLKPPAPTYRMSPKLIAAVAWAGAFVLFLFPATLAARLISARWKASRPPQHLAPLERALLLIEWACRHANGEHDRRKALEALADALERADVLPLAEATRTFAWAKESPDSERAQELAAKARTVPEGGNGRTG